VGRWDRGGNEQKLGANSQDTLTRRILRRRNDIGRSLDNNYAGNVGDRLASLAGVGPMMLKIMASATLSAIRRDLWPVAAVHWFLRRVDGAQRRRTEK
jgi:hypothetical protein